MNEIIKEITKNVDDAIFEAFEQHGYTRAWLMDERNAGRVTVYETEIPEGIIKSYFVDEKALFNVFQYMDIEVDPVLGPINSKMVVKISSC